MDKQKLIKDIIESVKRKNASSIKKTVESFLYSNAAERVKDLKTESAKSIFKGNS
jgi:hypothetical protein